MKRGPLLLSISFTSAATFGFIVGPFVLEWGLALAFPAGMFVIALGTWRHPEDTTLPAVLAGALAVNVGYGAATIAVTSVALAGATNPQPAFLTTLGVSDLASAEGVLWQRWGTLLLGIPIATVTLLRRWRSARR